jgi:hypothetical protein
MTKKEVLIEEMKTHEIYPEHFCVMPEIPQNLVFANARNINLKEYNV